MKSTRLIRTFAASACTAMLIVSGLAATASAARTPLPPTAIECPAAAGTARFVRALYVKVLYRCPGAGEVSYWKGVLDAGMTRQTLAQVFLESDEAVGNDARDIVRIGLPLGTEPPLAEYSQTVLTIRSQHSLRGALASHLANDQLWNLAYAASPSQATAFFLDRLYRLTLGRDIDAGASAYFQGMLGTNPTHDQRLLVALFVANSPEADSHIVSNAYRAYLNRDADSGGLTYWTTWLAGAGHRQDLIFDSILLGSDEAYTYDQTQPNPPVIVTEM